MYFQTDKNLKRRRVEDRLAVLFMGIVAVFFVCTLPRIMLNLYETVVMEEALECSRLMLPSFPAWVREEKRMQRGPARECSMHITNWMAAPVSRVCTF